MARTALSTTNLTGTPIAQPAGTAVDVTNGHVIAHCEFERTLLRVTNTAGADKVVTIKAGAYPPALASGLGDLTFTVPATTGVFIVPPQESGRFMQADGSMHIDYASGHTGTITAFKLPKAV
ncbi:hypothetical protein [Saccharothrix stipae]